MPAWKLQTVEGQINDVWEQQNNGTGKKIKTRNEEVAYRDILGRLKRKHLYETVMVDVCITDLPVLTERVTDP